MERSDLDQIKVQKVRAEIDGVDNQILKLLQQRFRLSKKMGMLKKKMQLMILDRKREMQIYQRLAKNAKGSHLDLHLITGIWKYILKKSYQIQRQVINDKSS